MTGSTVELARRIADELERDGIDYALGGALAFAYWGPPRGTVDVDVDLFCQEGSLECAFRALHRAGVDFDECEARRSFADRGDFRGSAGDIRVDVFVAFDEFHTSARLRRARPPLLGRPVWVLSAEDLAVFKILFDRPKDWIDLERMIALQGERFDDAYVRDWLLRWVEPDDDRLRRLQEIVRKFRGR